MNIQPVFFFSLTTVCFVSALFFLQTQRYSAEKYCLWAGCACSASALAALTHASGRMPVFADFESMLLTTFMLGVLISLGSPHGDSGTEVRRWGYIFVFILLSFCLISPQSHDQNEYLYHNVWVILFHVFRRISLALMLFASGFFFQNRKNGGKTVSDPAWNHQGRNYLILGAICFLISEYSGMIWCQQGWGDFWHWSSVFFHSTLVLLYLMTAFHIPGRNEHAARIRSLLGGLSGVFFLAMTMIRSLL